MIREAVARKEMIAVCRMLHERGLTSAADGNLSVRLDEHRLLATPSGFNKSLIGERDLILTDLEGEKLEGEHNPSSEMRMHALAYRERPDIGAVLHAHPPTCVALSLAGMALDDYLLPEIVISLGRIPTASYATPTTEELAQSVAPLIGSHNAIILDRHGTLTVGKKLLDAYNHLERMEHAARIVALASQFGPLKRLTGPQVETLLGIGKKFGLLPRGC